MLKNKACVCISYDKTIIKFNYTKQEIQDYVCYKKQENLREVDFASVYVALRASGLSYTYLIISICCTNTSNMFALQILKLD